MIPVSLQQKAMEMRHQRIPSRRIAEELEIEHQELTRFFSNMLYLKRNSKLKPDEPGECDFSHLDRAEEAAKSAEKWFGAMRGARWDTQRRPDQG